MLESDDFKKETIKKIERIANSENPIEKFKYAFGHCSLERLLSNGTSEALGKCLYQARNSPDALKYLLIIDAIIPPVPNVMVSSVRENIFDGFSGKIPNIVNFHSLVDCVILAISTKDTFPMEIPSEVLLKVVYYAEYSYLERFTAELIFFIENHLSQHFNDLSHIALALITVLHEKLPEIWLFFKMKEVVKYFDDFNMPPPIYRMLQDTVFNEKCLTSALRCVAQIIDENQITNKHFILTGLLHKFHSLLCNPSEIGDQSFVVKSFLTVFLNFETGTEDCYTWESKLFEKLVRLVVGALNYFLDCPKTTHRREQIYIDSPLSTTESIKNATVTAELLESLHILNSTWHQWFDIVVENNIIADNLFVSTSIEKNDIYLMKLFDQERRFSLIRTCPAMATLQYKCQEIMTFSSKHRNNKYFTVSRSNFMNDVFDIFRQDGDLTSHYWNITFKDEIASGPGVTREFYSILSDEMQRHFIGRWPGEPFRMSDNEMIHSHSTDVSEETDEFEILGKIMAKVILDKQCLDIPLSNEFFRRLRPTHFRNHSHLKRDYFDLLETFPMLETLFKQLLPVKRKIESVRAEVGLSEQQKKEIISNLTFNDGNSFDDLCLNFTVPGTDIELIESGRDVLLSPHNIDLYFEKLSAYQVELYSASKQFQTIKSEIDKVLHSGLIDMLFPQELARLVCGGDFCRWTKEKLSRVCLHDKKSISIQFLFQCLASFDEMEQRLFLKFVTGRKCLPHGGFSELKLTIRTINHDHADSSLPSAATCLNLLYLPNYTSLDVTRQKLLYAIKECQNSFAFA